MDIEGNFWREKTPFPIFWVKGFYLCTFSLHLTVYNTITRVNLLHASENELKDMVFEHETGKHF